MQDKAALEIMYVMRVQEWYQAKAHLLSMCATIPAMREYGKPVPMVVEDGLIKLVENFIDSVDANGLVA